MPSGCLQRCQKWLDVLDQRIIALLSDNDVRQMEAKEREQAACNYLLAMLQLLQLRQRYALAPPSAGEEALLDALLSRMRE